jgi:hypothetical protein
LDRMLVVEVNFSESQSAPFCNDHPRPKFVTVEGSKCSRWIKQDSLWATA